MAFLTNAPIHAVGVLVERDVSQRHTNSETGNVKIDDGSWRNNYDGDAALQVTRCLMNKSTLPNKTVLSCYDMVTF